MRHSACESAQRVSKSAVADFDINGAEVGQARLRWRTLTLAQGNALGLDGKTNPSPQRARQCIPQLRFGIGTPFQGLMKFGRRFPGRCPGLKLNRPFGALDARCAVRSANDMISCAATATL